MFHCKSAWLRPYLMFTAGLCGAMVMVLEVLGSRVLGPFFGVSLFVWTSLITVTMLALAVGYFLGGRLADRNPSPSALYAVVIAAGICVLAIPFVQLVVLKTAVGLGLRWGSLISAMLLFGPALALLGCVSPLLVRLLVREFGHLGRTVGGLAALSTAGSFAGTLVTGFFLIGAMGIGRIFVSAGLLLILLGVGYFLGFRRNWTAVVLFPLCLLLIPVETLPAKTLPDGTRAQVISQSDSFYGHMRVLDYRFANRHTRELTIDGLIQGGIDLDNGLSVYEYPYLLQFLPRALHPRGRNCLVIGLGSGVVPRWYASQGVDTEVVDIDQQVVHLAREYFQFPNAIPVHVQDARQHLAEKTRTYDYIVLDVFGGDTTPGHLLSTEAVQLISERLKHDGVLAINLVGSLDVEAFITASIVRTLNLHFGQVDIYPVFPESQTEQMGNLVIMAYRGPPRVTALDGLKGQAVHTMAQELVGQSLSRRFTFKAGTPAMILSDDFNPSDLRDLWVKEKLREHILKSTDLDLLHG